MEKIQKNNESVIILGNSKWKDDTFLDTPLDKLNESDIWVVGGGLYFDLFGVNENYKNIKNYPYDYVFEMHTLETRSDGYLEFLTSLAGVAPLIMQEAFREYHAVKYPLEKIIDKFGNRYFMCTFSYMIALAIYMGYKKIKIFGVNMAFLDDYTQKYNCDFWIGMALGMGIDVEISNSSDLLKMPKLYGYEADNTLAVTIWEAIKNKNMAILRSINMINSEILQEQLTDLFKSLWMDKSVFMREIYYRHGLPESGTFNIEGQNNVDI